MKKTALFFLLITICCYCYSQDAPGNGQLNHQVRITKWGQVVFGIPDFYWEQEAWTNEVIAKVGPEEFQKIKKFMKQPVIPVEMSIFSGLTISDTAVLFKRMNKLNIYKVATFSLSGEDGKIFEFAILRVPYEDNRAWDSNVKWTMIYYFIESKYVEEVI